MAKKNNEAIKPEETVVVATEEVVAEEVVAEAATEKTKDDIRKDIDALIDRRNKMAKIGAYSLIEDIDKKIADAVAEYSKKAEAECFDKLKRAKNPLKEAAKVMTFDTVKVKDEKDDKGRVSKVVDDTKKIIDPERLHKAVKGGVGANKEWIKECEALNCFMTVLVGLKFGIPVKSVYESYSMKEESVRLRALLFDGGDIDLAKASAKAQEEVQYVVDAMIGEVCVGKGKAKQKVFVSDELVNYLESIYTKKSTKSLLEVQCANHKNFRKYMLEICYAVITGNAPSVGYKTK